MLIEKVKHKDEEVKRAVDELAEVRNGAMPTLLAAVSPFSGFTKITDKATREAAIGAAIVANLSVIMSRSHSTTWLRIVCEALFDYAVFGMKATQAVLSELYQKHFFKHTWEMFAPWKVLRAIDLSSVGELNYNGVKTLRRIECIEKNQERILPAWATVQKAAYELNHLGQGIILFEKKESQFGEMFQFDFELFLHPTAGPSLLDASKDSGRLRLYM
jgi:hypothetical protein